MGGGEVGLKSSSAVAKNTAFDSVRGRRDDTSSVHDNMPVV